MEKKSTNNTKPAYNENVIAALAYILFFLPLILTPESKLGRYHATQSAHLLIYAIVISIIASFVFFPLIFLMPLLQLGIIALAIIGFLNAYKGEKKPLPLIGKYTFFEL